MGQRKAHSAQKVFRFRQAQFQGDGKGQHRGLAGLVLGVVVDFPEGLFADVSSLVALNLGDVLFVNQLQKRHRKGVVLVLQPVLQTLRSRGLAGHRFFVGSRFYPLGHGDPLAPALRHGHCLTQWLHPGGIQKPFQLSPTADPVGIPVINAQEHPHILIPQAQEIPDGLRGNGQHPILGKAEGPSGDQGKGNAFRSQLRRPEQSIQVAASQKSLLIGPAALPDRPHGVKDIFAGQVIASRHPDFAGAQSFQLSARLGQAWPGSLMNSQVYPARAGEPAVRGVYDGIHPHLGNVAVDDGKGHGGFLPF